LCNTLHWRNNGRRLHDIDYQKFLIDRYVNSVYAYNDKIVIIFNVGNNGKNKDKITPEDIKKVSSPESSVNDTIGGTVARLPEPLSYEYYNTNYIFVKGFGGFYGKTPEYIAKPHDPASYIRERTEIGKFKKKASE
jgi:hypothetical protein